MINDLKENNDYYIIDIGFIDDKNNNILWKFKEILRLMKLLSFSI